MKFGITGWGRFREALREPYEPENMRLVAGTYWYLILVCGLMCAVLAIGYGSTQFANVSSTLDAATQAARSPQVNLDRSKLQDVVVGFAARADRYSGLKAQPLAVPSPSN